MSLKLKLILGVLVLGALFFGYQAATGILPNTITPASLSPSSLTAQIGTANIPADTDHDGLDDYDETEYKTDYKDADSDDDGYLDGEEVLSGYDPTQATDDDLNAPKNVTQMYLNRLMAGVAAGDLNPKNNDPAKRDAGLQMIALATLTDAQTVIANDQSITKINVIPDNVENITDYGNFVDTNLNGSAFQFPFGLQKVRLIVALDQIKNNNPDRAVKTFAMYERFFTKQAAIWRATSVPKTFVNFHTMFLNYLTTMEGHYRAAANMKSDPMLAQIALTAIPTLNDKIMNDVADELINIVTSLKTYLPGLSL